ncbi:MAG: PSD1 and planctomycete cytochrome C domain-containing protein [Pirellulales bacterium]
MGTQRFSLLLALPLLLPPLANARNLAILAALIVAGAAVAAELPADEDAFFIQRVLPVLRSRCFHCHSHESEINGGLALDVKNGWRQGGESGPAIVPGKPEESLLVAAVRHAKPDYEMPPDGKIPDHEIATLVEWVERGAPDPRQTTAADAWEKLYAERLAWWSLEPVARPPAPAVKGESWPRTDIDRFILARLEENGLAPAAEASPEKIARRLALVLTGLPPEPAVIAAYLRAPSPAAYDRLVESLLASPHYGEQQARHWMDVVHYSDTHGYEWDVPAKNAWMYRDYLVRAFNADLPYDQFVLEQLAGDLIPPRVDLASNLNEAIIGPMALRMGERRHGDSAGVDGTTEENLADMIDTATKAFLGTTVGCARCHDHKLDAVAQADYYALAGVFLSSRWSVRCADAADPNVAVIAELRGIKDLLRPAVAARWLGLREAIIEKAKATAIDAKATGIPESLAGWLRLPAERLPKPEEFAAERQRRIDHNKKSLNLIADFTTGDAAAAGGWRWEGSGMEHGLARHGELIVLDEGDAAVKHLVPAGRWSHLWSSRQAGALRSPELFARPPRTFSVGLGSGLKASWAPLVDRAFHSERLNTTEYSPGAWVTFTAGNFERLSGPADTADRRVTFELSTKALDNYFPPRVDFGRNEAEVANPRSWIGATKVYEHPAGQGPRDELSRFEPLVTAAAAASGVPADREAFATRVADLVLAAVARWRDGGCTADDVLVINEALKEKWLDATALSDSEVARLVAAYRAAEKRLVPDRVIGSMADWHEGADARLAVRGSPTDLGAVVPRGTIGFIRDTIPGSEEFPPAGGASGRFELARSIVDPQNPLTARVYVNRVWLHLFGEGLVRTPDDFGHLGEPPVHGDLLDYLASRFVEEGWSTKKLVREIVRSAVWRVTTAARSENVAVDPENRLWHHHPRRRLAAEEIRDSMLAVSGRLDHSLGGPPIDPPRAKEDPQKRLVSGPLDGRGRRSIYVKMTLMEPPRFLATFNQPMPRVCVGKRDRSTAPEQALALLNDSFVLAMAEKWGANTAAAKPATVAAGAEAMLAAAYGRRPAAADVERLVALADRCGFARGVPSAEWATSAAVWKDVAHAIFLMQEFTHVE